MFGVIFWAHKRPITDTFDEVLYKPTTTPAEPVCPRLLENRYVCTLLTALWAFPYSNIDFHATKLNVLSSFCLKDVSISCRLFRVFAIIQRDRKNFADHAQDGITVYRWRAAELLAWARGMFVRTGGWLVGE